MPERERRRIAPEDVDVPIDLPEALELPDVQPDDDAVGIVDPAEEIGWTPPGGHDDEEARDLPIGEPDIDADDLEGGPASNDAEGPHPHSIDPGDLDGGLDDAGAAIADEAASTLDDGEDEIDTDDREEPDDGGAEGTSEDISSEVDESALPEVDADEDGAFDVDDLMRELVAGGFGREGQSPPWVAREEWTTSDAFQDVAAFGGRVVAVGADLVALEPGATTLRRARLGRMGSRVALGPGTAVVGMGQAVTLLASPESAPLVLFESPRAIAALGVANGRVWAIAGDELWAVASPPSTPKRLREAGAIDLVTAGANLLLLSAESGRLALERFRGDDGDWQRLALPTIAREPARLAASSSGDGVALLTRDAIHVSRDAGASFETIAVPGAVALTFAADGVFYVLAASDEGAVVIADRGGKREEIPIGRLLGAMATPERLGAGLVRLAWCDVRETLYVVTSGGSTAIGPRRTH